MTSIATNFRLACSAKDEGQKVILNNVMSDLCQVSKRRGACPPGWLNKGFPMKLKSIFTISLIFTASYLWGVEDVASISREIDVKLKEIDDAFLASSPDVDNWMLFMPLLELVDQRRLLGEDECVEDKRNLSKILNRFVLYSFACRYDSLKIKADFSGRKRCVELFATIVAKSSDEENLYLLAQWLSGANIITVKKSEVDQDFKSAIEQDALIIYGGKTQPRYPGSIGAKPRMGPTWRAVKEKLDFRSYYNQKVIEFRRFAFSVFHKEICNGFEKVEESRRKLIWEEFCRRAKATEEEKIAAEKAVRRVRQGSK